jgi:hypothetical protein
MPRQPKPKPDNPEQFKRFMQTAKEIGAGPPSEDFDRVLKKVAETPRDSEPKNPRG